MNSHTEQQTTEKPQRCCCLIIYYLPSIAWGLNKTIKRIIEYKQYNLPLKVKRVKTIKTKLHLFYVWKMKLKTQNRQKNQTLIQ